MFRHGIYTSSFYTNLFQINLLHFILSLPQDIPSYTLLDVNACLEYFYISPDTGAFSLRRALYENPTNQYTVSDKQSLTVHD